MRVVHISSSEGTAPFRIHTGLRRIGVDSSMWVTRRRREDPSVALFEIAQTRRDTLRRRFRQARMRRAIARYEQAKIFEAFVDDRTMHGGDLLPQLPRADIIHVHVLHHVADFDIFHRTVPLRVPVVRTLHDEHFFTGGCTQDGGCQRYLTGCGCCPQLGSNHDDDLSRQSWLRKRRALEGVPPGRLSLVAPSRWLAEIARRSPLHESIPITVIPLGIDTSVFRPLNRLFARRVLGIPAEAKVVAFVAEPIHRANKGFATLVKALDGSRTGQDSDTSIWLLSAGSGRIPVPVPVPHRRLGRVSDERFMALLYNAADVFALPSLQENCPQTAIEALACGVPVVGSETGGVPEIVRVGRTGILVPPGSVPSLREAMRTLFVDEAQRRQLGGQGREVAAEEYALDIQARRYLAVYQEMLEPAGQSMNGLVI